MGAKPRRQPSSAARVAASRKNGAKGGRPRGPRHHDEYAKVGPPPDDPLEAAGWAQRLLMVAMHKVATDPHLDERQRRQELRSTADKIADLIPQERLREAEKLIREDAQKAQKPPGPEMTYAPVQPEGPLRAAPRRSKR